MSATTTTTQSLAITPRPQYGHSTPAAAHDDADVDEAVIDFDDESRLPPLRNLWLSNSTFFAKMVVMTVVLTTSDEYTDKLGLGAGYWPGLLIGIVPAAAGLSVFFWQWLCSSYLGGDIKATLVAQTALGSLGCAMYALANVASSPALLIAGRILAGSAGAVNIILEYITITTGKKHKNKVVGVALSFTNLGYATGPLIGSIMYLIFTDTLGLTPASDSDVITQIFNTLTIPGWFGSVMYAAMTIVFAVAWKPLDKGIRDRYAKHERVVLDNSASTHNDDVLPQAGRQSALLIAGLLASAFSVGVGISSVETRTSFMAQYDWTLGVVDTGYYIFGAFLVVAAIGYAGNNPKLFSPCWPQIGQGQLEDRAFIFIAYFLATIGVLFFFDFLKGMSIPASATVWTFGLLVFAGALVLGRAVVFSLTMKLCPNTWFSTVSSLLGLLNAFGRGVGPVIATYIGHGYLQPTLYSSILMGVFLSNTLGIAIMF